MGVNRPVHATEAGHSLNSLSAVPRRLNSEFMIYGGGIIQSRIAGRVEGSVVTRIMVELPFEAVSIGSNTVPADARSVLR